MSNGTSSGNAEFFGLVTKTVTDPEFAKRLGSGDETEVANALRSIGMNPTQAQVREVMNLATGDLKRAAGIFDSNAWVFC